MQQLRAVLPSLLLVGFLFSTLDASAATVTLDAVNRGYFRHDGRHITANENTTTGRISTPRRYNSFFVFDLGSLAGTVDSAILHLELDLFTAPFSTITFDVFDVSATAAELDATYLEPSTPGTTIYNDLGSGNIYATETVSATDVGTVLNLPLNNLAQTDIDSQLGNMFAVGLRLQGPDSGDYYLRFGDDDTLETIQLELELTPPVIPSVSNPVPEPDGLICLACLCGWFFRVSPLRRTRAV